jgi:two-component system response regulator RegX3
MKKVLLLEDDLSLIEGLQFSLEKHGFEVTVSRTVKQARELFSQNVYQLAILDLMLPDGNGFDVCRTIRDTSGIPVIFLTASDEEVNIVMGLDIGGDDYITKPFKLNELLSRINAALRRSDNVKEQLTELCANGITVKLLEGRTIKNGTDIELTSVEYRLLCLFMQNPRIVLSKDQIMQRLWDCNENFVDDNTLAVYISRLRDKIEDIPKRPTFLTTIRGMGYRWNKYEAE